jgi:hypothetical protein
VLVSGQAEGGGKYGNRLSVVRGDLYGKPRQYNRQRAAVGFTTAEFRLDREMHEVFCAFTAEDGVVPSRAVQEIREHRQHPWRVIARRFREARKAGVPLEQLHAVINVLHAYARELYRETEQRRA